MNVILKTHQIKEPKQIVIRKSKVRMFALIILSPIQLEFNQIRTLRGWLNSSAVT